MSKKRMVSMVGGTLTCALAIGFFMQRGETAAPRSLVATLPSAVEQAVLKPKVSMAPMSLMSADVSTQNDMQNLVNASSMAPVMIAPSLPEPKSSAQPQVHASLDGTSLPNDPKIPNLGCDVRASATPKAFAMIALDISAPCFTNERLTVHHNGLMFTLVTNEMGQVSVDVPALTDRAVFIVAFGDGVGTVVMANVPEVYNYDRVAVQWIGDAGFQIHAREFGAAYGESGHVWSGAVLGAHPSFGKITRLGMADTLLPQLAEVYTFPSGTTSDTGIIALSIEAEVTAENCGRDISAQSLELRDRSPMRTRELMMAMPDCGAIGDFLVLNNLVEDLTIAAR